MILMSIRSRSLWPRFCVHRHFATIKIPERIERGPTDILEALASTVKRDESAPHYKYHDDPFLIPRNFLNQRSFALSKESGRKAARFFLDKYPELFYRDDAEPKIPAFSYKDQYNPDLEYGESDLINCIHSSQVLNSIQLYNDLKEKNVVLSEKTIQSLLELVCFYNCNEKCDPEYLEESWFGRDEPENTQRKVWDDASFATTLFNEMENKSESTYSAMIRGLGKFNAGSQTYRMYQEAKEKGFRLDTETYNHVIKIVPFVRETSDARWEVVHGLLVEMDSKGLVPDTNTFTELLQVIYRNTNWAPGTITSLKLMSEMKRLKIEPSLATFYYLNLIHHRTGSYSHILPSIITEVEKMSASNSLRLKHMKDFDFFPSMMKTCYMMYNDLDLGYRIHSLLLSGNNQRFIGNGFGEQTYFQNFFLLIAENESFKNVLNWYEKYVPNIYGPSPTVFAAILKSIVVDQAYDQLPRLWKDIVDMEMVKDKTLKAFISVLSDVQPGEKSFNQSIVKVSMDIFKWIKNSADDNLARPEFATPTDFWSGAILSQLLLVLIRFDHHEDAIRILESVSSHGSEISGEISPDVFESLCLKAMENKDIKHCSFLIKYSATFGQSLDPFIQKHLDTVDETIRQDLKQIRQDLKQIRQDLKQIRQDLK